MANLVSRNDAALAKASRIVHIKCIEVEFKEEHTKRPLAICLMMNDVPLDRSPWLEYRKSVAWDVNRQFELPSQMAILVRKAYKIRDHRDIIKTSIDLDHLFMKPIHLIDEPDGEKLSIKIQCEATGEFGDLIRRLIEESQQRMESMKVFMQRFAKVCEYFNICVKVAMAPAEANSVAKATVSAVARLYECCKTFDECYEAASDVVRDIESFPPFTEIPLDRLKSNMTEKAVKEMLVLFEKIVRSTLKYSSDRTLGALLAIGEKLDEVNSYKEELMRAKAMLDWCIKTEVWKTALNIEQNTDSLVLDKLCPVMDAFYEMNAVCLEGPRRKIVRTIKNWTANTSGLKIFWLHGFAGSRKTTIVHTVSEMLDHENRLAGCFLCARDGTRRDNPKKVIPTIAYQLSTWHKAYLSLVVELLNRPGELELRTGLEKQYELLVEKLLQQLAVGVRPSHKPLVIVLGAQDQCCDSEASRRLLLKFIRRIANVAPWLKVFVSSMKTAEIEDGLQCDDLQACDIGDPWHVLQDEIAGSVAYLEESRIDTGVRADHLEYRAASLFPKIHRGLDCVVNNSCPVPEFDAMLGLQLSTFFRMLLRIVFGKEVLEESTMFPTRSCLAITACISHNSVTSVSVLLQLLKLIHPTIQEDELVATIRSLRPLVSEDQEGNIEVLLPRRALMDFLSERESSGSLWVDVEKFPEWCFESMKAQLKFNLCSLESVHAKNDEVFGLESQITRRLSGRLHYCLHWMDYVVRLNDIHRLRGRVQKFLCSPTALYWAEVLSLIGSLENGKAVLQKCIKYFKDDEEIVQAATVMHTFISDFHDAMAINTPHVYISALSWGLPNLTKALHRRGSTESLECSQSQADTSDNSVELTGSVTCFSLSPDESKLASGDHDGNLSIWDAVTGKLIRRVKMHDDDDDGISSDEYDDDINDVIFSPDGSRIVTGLRDKTLRIWDVQSGELVAMLKGHTDQVCAIMYSPDGMKIVSGSWDATLRIWDADSGSAIGKPLEGHADRVNAVAFSPDSSRIASGSDDNTVRIWDVRRRKQIGEPLSGHGDSVLCVSFSRDSNKIVSGSNDSTVRVWDARTGASVGEPMKGHESWVWSVAYTSDESRITSGSWGGLRIWDAVSLDPIGIIFKGESRWDQHGGYFPLYPSWWPTYLLLSTETFIHANAPTQIPKDGWLRTLDGGLFMWVPPKYRKDVCCRGLMGQIPPRMRFDWKKVPHGKEWTIVKEMIERPNET